ncbi:MAG: hypothetical protein D8B56_03425 [Alloprevotella sp.]|nr:MAG: hypothetical protein D8B56_03425 [Alloprevotella sp.]
MFAHHNFDFTRFCYVFKHDCLMHKKDLFKMWGGMFLGFFFILLLPTTYLFYHDYSIEHGLYTFVISLSLFAAHIFALIGASSIFADLKTKQARINYYMLPATSTEKYLNRLILSTFFVLIGIVVAFVAADLLNWVIRAIVREGGELVAFHIFDPLDQINFLHMDLIRETETQIIVRPEVFILPLPFFFFLSAEATYILGGTLFRRYAFILTTAFTFVLSVVITLILTLVASFMVKHYVDDFPTDIASESITQYILWLSVAIYLFHLLWTIGCIYFSYRMFKNSNVIINRSIGL